MIQLTERDLILFKTCLEMKFLTIDAISDLIFARHRAYAEKRTLKLTREGFLKSFQLAGKKAYICSYKAYSTAQNVYSSLPRPNNVNLATADHDYLVTKCRILLESQKRASNWRSERLLKKISNSELNSLRREFVPDAIFTSRSGIEVAFEFENSLKEPARLTKKLDYISFILSLKEGPFSACLFIAKTEKIKNRICELKNSELIVVQTLDALEKNEILYATYNNEFGHNSHTY